ncbi:3'(2'),5'-bisphosphate nucleotidase CysQ [Agrobacterium rubi]|uniref:3'(2'),5'-bisphosphate nucleotidase CysQ n=1 Tax=Agrobacterium rubi TaxID=28099 RepID=UPI0015724F01|nr:3'(2'),5'-bisphosphate nucleotidase CysQ [Agrobacterium rubi]NTF06558.1 3'(2'),5'-bisphosphate nucleotidase CysQ [Agrobacterium rubi]NTF18800.1 3'(2'),5'-bisphosphate nucleotidase CysQ [Agrobacterium rubi]NTF25763.1 3'(2'),5'-bisphosphate nucleotidase CysQ [Agrobacterium rubi]
MTDTKGADWRSDLDLIVDAARQAGRVALQFFRKDPEVWWKSGHSPVSAADYAANEVLATMLQKARPHYGWLSEETDDNEDRLSKETLFVVDPIDGTRAFINGKDTWCVSVAVVHQGRPVAAVLVAPAFEEEFTASLGAPAMKNGKVLSTSSSIDGQIQLAAPEDVIARLPQNLKSRIHRIAHVPSLAYRLAMVSDGRIDGTLVKADAHDWDLAAADLILEQAGGKLVDLDGNPLIYNRTSVRHPELCAAANHILPDLLAPLNLSARG